MVWISLFVFVMSLLLPAPLLYSFFQRDWRSPRSIKLLASFGLAPMFSSLLFYYALVFGQLFLVWICFWLVMIPFALLNGRLKRWHRDILDASANSKYLISMVFIFIFGYLAYAYFGKITEHDTFEYMALGKSLVNGFDPFNYRYLKESGFFYVGLHGLCYPILFAMEHGLCLFFGDNNFIGVKFLSGYYGLLLVLLFYFTMRDFYPALAKYATLYLLFSMGIIFSGLQFHLETMRIFMLVLTFYLFFCLISGNNVPLTILSISFGLQSYLHLTGFIVTILLAATTLIIVFKKDYTFNQIFVFVVGIIFFGGIHYFLELGERSGYFIKQIIIIFYHLNAIKIFIIPLIIN
jgi:hypothetical protein